MIDRRPLRPYSSALAVLGLLMAALPATEAFAQTVTQRIELAPGWNLVSLHVVPSDPSMPAVLATAGEAIHIVRDREGRVYDPAAGVDELSPWAVEQAYYVRATQAAVLEVSGTAVEAWRPIELAEGWNPVPYLLADASPVGEALAPVLADVHLVKDAEGNVYAPDYAIDHVGQLLPGQGYEVRMRRPATLAYATAPEVPEQRIARYDPACTSIPGYVTPEDGAALAGVSVTYGIAADSLQRADNATALNVAINETARGADGWTTLCLPADSIYLAHNDERYGVYDRTIPNRIRSDGTPRNSNGQYKHLDIRRDYVRVWGAGACGWGDLSGCTYIGTPGDRDSYYYRGFAYGPDQVERVIRDVGIGIAKSTNQRSGFVLRGFELDGHAGRTGCYSFSYSNAANTNDDCWDLSHKGIHIGSDQNVDDVLIEDVKVHRYRGEVMYAAGYGFDDVTVRRVWSYDSNGSANNFATAQNLLIEDSKFGPDVRFWHEFLAEHLDGLRATVRNNEYVGCGIGSGCIAVAFDDWSSAAEDQRWLFEGNNFECTAGDGTHLPAFQVEAGKYDLEIRNNAMSNCGVGFLGGGNGTYTLDFLFENNTVSIGNTNLMVFQGNGTSAYRGYIRGNTFTSSNGSIRAYSANGGDLDELAIEGNTFDNFSSPEFSGGGPVAAPLWQNNTLTSFGHVRRNFFNEKNPIDPTYDVFRTQAGSPISLELTTRHADGQRVKLKLDSGSEDITLPASEPQHGWGEDLVLRSGSNTVVVFDLATETWHLEGEAN